MDEPPGVAAGDVVLLYRELLDREPSREEVAHQQAAAAAWQDVLMAIVRSDEYAALVPAATPAPERVVNIHIPDLAKYGHLPGRRSADEVAEIGSDGFVFLIGGTNEILSQHRPGYRFEPGWREQWQQVIASRRAQAAELGVTYRMVLVPDKVTVLGERMAEPPPAGVRTPADELAALDRAMVFPVGRLQDAEGGAYLRTDTHLTLAGNRALAAGVGDALGIDLARDVGLDGRTNVACGDLGARFSPPVVELATVKGDWGRATVVENSAPEILARGRHVGIRQVLRTESARDDRRVLVFGDSYATASPHYQGLIWWLAQAFAEVHFLWIPFGWDPDYVSEVDPAIVLSEGAERFAARAPDVVTNAQAAIEAVRA